MPGRLTAARAALAALGMLGLLFPLGARGSGAAFVASATTPGASVATAADFNTVRVTLTDPGTPRRSPVRLTATAGSDRGIAWVRFERSAPGRRALDGAVHRHDRALRVRLERRRRLRRARPRAGQRRLLAHRHRR